MRRTRPGFCLSQLFSDGTFYATAAVSRASGERSSLTPAVKALETWGHGQQSPILPLPSAETVLILFPFIRFYLYHPEVVV